MTRKTWQLSGERAAGREVVLSVPTFKTSYDSLPVASKSTHACYVNRLKREEEEENDIFLNGVCVRVSYTDTHSHASYF